MPYGALPVERFGGLDLQGDPGEVALGAAVDAKNVLPVRSTEGGLKQRNGYNTFSTAVGNTGQAMAQYKDGGGTRHLLVGSGGELYALSTTGTLVRAAASDLVNRSVLSIANIGTTTGTFAYGASSAATMLRWNGTNFAAVAGSPFAELVAVQPTENRLVAARIQGNDSRVQFSDAGAPETWGANNYVDLHPGDGEVISAMVAWRELLFVFKRSKYFVFYGNSTDSTGSPVFNYRTVNVGKGTFAAGGATDLAVAAPEGVYFIAADGIYLTTGGPPRRLSEPIDVFFRAEQDGQTDFLGVGANSSAATSYRNLVYHENRLWASLATTSYTLGGNSYSQGVLVYDPTLEWWGVLGGGNTSHPLRFDCAATFEATDGSPDLFFQSGTGEVQRYGSGNQNYTTDRATAITSQYRSGFFVPEGGDVTVLREAVLQGTGTVGFALSDDWGSLSTATNVTLGTSPAIAEGRYRVAHRGRRFSWQVSSVSGGAWTLNGLRFHKRGRRPPGRTG